MDRIEILAVDLLDQHRPVVDELKSMAAKLGLEFGWHYLLDLTWMISLLGEVDGKKIMDAGAGTGVLQWYLAKKGATVYSVDRGSRANLPWRFRCWVTVRGLRAGDLTPPVPALVHVFQMPGSIRTRLRYARQMVQGCWCANPTRKNKSHGMVWILNQDLRQLNDIADASLDAVVALSALEHNPPQELPSVIQELMRVLKPGGLLLATLGAARDEDWFHEPSQGWCYSENTLRNAFELPADVSSNYNHYDVLFEQLRNCRELKDNLARFYFRSANNGMPWGVWNPQYQSVGVVKEKR